MALLKKIKTKVNKEKLEDLGMKVAVVTNYVAVGSAVVNALIGSYDNSLASLYVLALSTFGKLELEERKERRALGYNSRE